MELIAKHELIGCLYEIILEGGDVFFLSTQSLMQTLLSTIVVIEHGKKCNQG